MRINYFLTSSLQPKIGISVLKKFGKAHDRNRFKRLAKEAFRHCKNALPLGIEMQISPLSDINLLTLAEIQSEFHQFIKKVQSYESTQSAANARC